MRSHPPALPPALALLLAVACGGCGSTPKAGDLPSDPQEREIAIGELLSLRDPQTGEDKGAVFLEVTIANSRGIRVVARCAPEWYDAKGAILQPARNWQSVDLEPHSERRLRFTPVPAGVRSWRMRFAP